MEMLHCVHPPCKLRLWICNMKAVFDCDCMRLAYFLIPLNYWVSGRKRLCCLLSISKLDVAHMSVFLCVCVLSMCVSVSANNGRDAVHVCLITGEWVCGSIVGIFMVITCINLLPGVQNINIYHCVTMCSHIYTSRLHSVNFFLCKASNYLSNLHL